MLYTIPDYYDDFTCIADACEDTCCAGWQIVIDKESLQKYKRIRGNFRKRMLRSVNWFGSTFRQDKDKRCAFLNENNLCDLYLAQGEDGFCKTCREYPRHTEEFEGVREITLSLSCPEVARIVMNRMEPVDFISREDDTEEEFDDFDPFLYSVLNDARNEMIRILQDRNCSVAERSVLVLGMAHDMQGRMNRRELFDCMSVIDKYGTGKALIYVREYLGREDVKEKRTMLAGRMFSHLYELELLRKEWGILLDETQNLLYGDRDEYRHIKAEFEAYQAANPAVDIHLEQLLVYFLFTYFPGAVYDGEIYAKAQLAVYSVWMIWELWMARWFKNEKTLDLEEKTELVYRFSREVEHSDLNLKTIEKIMEKKWFLKGEK